MKITRVTATPIRPPRPLPPSWLGETVIANPMSVYPQYRARRSSWTARFGPEVLVRVETDEGITGIGAPVPAPAKDIVEHHFAHLLVGEDPRNVEMLWDQMWRASLPYGRKGLPVMALSAVDVALWDIVGKARGEPLYRLLGGATRERTPCYATGNDVELHRRLRFKGYKLAMPYGPADGYEGMKKNVELVEKAREQAGPDMEIMLDCYMAWDVEYTIRMCRLLEPYRILWVEECLPPDDYDGYAELTAKVTSTTIATGEHEYTRWGFKELLVRRCCGILQPDLAWCGGITEARKIAALASAFHVPVIPHAGGLQPWAVHFIHATVNVPWAELVVIGDRTEEEPLRPLYPFFRGWEGPVDGWIAPPERPGIGVDVDPEWLEQEEGTR